MKIIFANRHDSFTKMGGDTFQMVKTKQYLEEIYSFEIVIVLSAEDIRKYKEIEVVHIFNLQTAKETLEYIRVSKEEKKKIVLSTIYWDLSEMFYISKVFPVLKSYNCIYLGRIFKDILFKSNNFFKKIMKKSSFGYMNQEYIEDRVKIIEEVDILLPNSFEELEIISKDFKMDYNKLLNKTKVIPNAVERGKTIYYNTKKLDIKNYILQVGRIELVKNQLGLVRALKNDKDIPILLIGRRDVSGNDKYYNKLKIESEKRGNVYFIDEIRQEELNYYYENALVHILPSFRESPGLVTLEAIKNRTNVVVADKRFCPTEYYKFFEIAEICNPYNLKSIREAIMKAMKKKKLSQEEVANYLKEFSYEKVAKLTYEVYKVL